VAGAQGRNPVGVGGDGWDAQPRVAARTPQPWALFHCPVGASETGRTMGRERVRSRGDGSDLGWGRPACVPRRLSGALKGRCTPAQGNALGTRVPLPHSTLKGCNNRTSHTALCRTPSGCWIGGRRFSQGVALGWYVLPFQGRLTMACRSLRVVCDRSPGLCVNGCVSVHAGTGLTCGLLVVVVSGPAAAG
jgi:hypothetical protein